MFNAIKTVYDFKTKRYNVVAVKDVEAGNVIAYANSGYMIYNNVAKAITCVEKGTMRLPAWNNLKRDAVLAHLKAEKAAEDLVADAQANGDGY